MMRAPSFEYRAPKTLAEAAAALAEGGPESMLLSGGTDLIPNMKRRQQTPPVVIGLRGVSELRRLEATPGQDLVLGAGVTLSEVVEQPGLRGAYEALYRAASQVATPHIRNMGTVGGNLCLDTRCTYYNQSQDWRKSIDFCMKAPGPTGLARQQGEDGTCWVAPNSSRCWAVSSTDLAPALVALGAQVTLVSKSGSREIPLEEMYGTDGMAFLTRRWDEILAGVRVPAPKSGARSTYWKLRRRNSFDFPVLGVAANVELDSSGVVRAIRVVLGAVESRPLLLDADMLVGRTLSDEAIEAFVEATAPQARPLDNTDFTLSWRKKMAREFLAGALKELRGDTAAQLGALARHSIGAFAV